MGIDPHALGAVARHPLLAHVLLYIVARTQDGQRHCSKYDEDDDDDASPTSQEEPVCVAASAWGYGNELTGPAGWRRVLAAYRR